MGMQDTITSATYWQIEFGFTDGDYRSIKVPNPNEMVATEAKIRTLDAWVNANQPIIGDKTGASTTGVNSALIVDSTRIKLDLT